MSTENVIERHELHKAYQLIFDEDPRGAGLLLEREALARTFRERAYQFRPDRAEEIGRPRKELQEALKAVALAFDLLADVVGEADRVWIMPVVDNHRAQAVRPWAPRSAAASSVKVHARKTSGDVEEATKRIKEAIGKLKAQTEALAKGRPSRKTPPAETAKSVPSRKPLILGRHLHRRGLITLRQLIAAVAWQRGQRPAVGKIAKSWGILTDEQIFEVIQDKDQGELFCDYAVRKGLMTPFQRLAVVGRQRVMQKPIGSYFVEQGILSEEDIAKEVRALQALRGEDSSEKR
ncbi:MAG: hypothetical protein AAFU79_21750 [Myxococcota bacterium]